MKRSYEDAGDKGNNKRSGDLIRKEEMDASVQVPSLAFSRNPCLSSVITGAQAGYWV